MGWGFRAAGEELEIIGHLAADDRAGYRGELLAVALEDTLFALGIRRRQAAQPRNDSLPPAKRLEIIDRLAADNGAESRSELVAVALEETLLR